MLTQIAIRRFKRFDSVVIELSNPVIFIGPNNSGKTSALQALALWALGVRKWSERRGKGSATKRTGVSINRREIINIPLLNSYALWRSLQVRRGNTPIRIEIVVSGTAQNGELWSLGLEFESVDPDNIRCRPIETSGDTAPPKVPTGAKEVLVAFLPPMSGLIAQEDLLQPGSIDRRIGEGRTADVLRNLCYKVYTDSLENWALLSQQMKLLFGAKLLPPDYDPETGTISQEYEEDGTRFNLLASGQGFRQTLLLLAYLYNNPGAVLLLDEPDAHLEILRQRQIYQVLSEIGHRLNCQVIIATHSEVILNEAAGRDYVIAFVGRPHPISKAAEIRKALAEYGFEHYAQAEQTGWVLYLEGSTDSAILRALAGKLNHPASDALDRAFVHYVVNQPQKAIEHFRAMQAAFPDVRGLALFDQYGKTLPSDLPYHLQMAQWTRRELENYIVTPRVLMASVSEGTSEDLFGHGEREHRTQIMAELIEQLMPRIAQQNPDDRWWVATKMSDDFLDRLFEMYFAKLEMPNAFRKSDYHKLVTHLQADQISSEVVEKLDTLYAVYLDGQKAKETWIDPTGDSK